MREQLDSLIAEMVDKGIRYADAQREFERRFIAQVLDRQDGCLLKAAKALGIHRNTLSRKLVEHRLKRR
ncbi:MAG: histidine kinase [Acidobacteriota bacterium]|nr:histidine kinase [Acidobacteriota bacterium]